MFFGVLKKHGRRSFRDDTAISLYSTARFGHREILQLDRRENQAYSFARRTRFEVGAANDGRGNLPGDSTH